MAFTGAPVVEQISGNLCRITGVTLAAGADGVIGLDGSGLEVELPDGFEPSAYDDVSLVDGISVTYQQIAAAANPPDISYVKAAGPPFSITITNNDAAVTAGLEIYVRWK